MHRANLTVLTQALVKKISIQEKTAQGVEFRHPQHGECFVEARRETILAAGAIGSPQILQLSGIGPGALLEARGIEILHDLPGVGENLHDHLQIRMQYRVHGVPTLNERANSLWGKAAMAFEYLLLRSGDRKSVV